MRFCADSCRRQFHQAVLSSAVVGVAIQTGIELATPEKLSVQTSLGPGALLTRASRRFRANCLIVGLVRPARSDRARKFKPCSTQMRSPPCSTNLSNRCDKPQWKRAQHGSSITHAFVTNWSCLRKIVFPTFCYRDDRRGGGLGGLG
jgi:hypothetical protein